MHHEFELEKELERLKRRIEALEDLALEKDLS